MKGGICVLAFESADSYNMSNGTFPFFKRDINLQMVGFPMSYLIFFPGGGGRGKFCKFQIHKKTKFAKCSSYIR